MTFQSITVELRDLGAHGSGHSEVVCVLDVKISHGGVEDVLEGTRKASSTKEHVNRATRHPLLTLGRSCDTMLPTGLSTTNGDTTVQ